MRKDVFGVYVNIKDPDQTMNAHNLKTFAIHQYILQYPVIL